MKQSEFGQPRRQGGISLIPALWERIEEAAELGGVSRNRVMERVLMERFGLATDVHKTTTRGRNMHSTDGAVELVP